MGEIILKNNWEIAVKRKKACVVFCSYLNYSGVSIIRPPVFELSIIRTKRRSE